MAILKVDTITSADTPTVSITDGASISGVTTFSSDINIADKIVHTGDTNTAIRFSDADTISFETAGSARAFINSAGDLTIGGSAGTLGKLYIKQAADTDSEGVSLLNSGGSNSFRMYLGDSSGAVAHIGHGGQKQFNITQAGLVGVGTATPDALLHLGAISGSAQLKMQRTNNAANTNDYGRIYWESYSGTLTGQISVARESAENDGYMHFKTASSGTLTERLRITSAGQTQVTGSMKLQNSGNVSFNIRDTSANAVSNWLEIDSANALAIYNCYKEGVGTKYPHVFKGYTTEYARIDDGGIKFDGDTAAANGLDDYEEGNITWYLRKSDNTSGGNDNGSVVKYTKVGRMVVITGRIRTDSTSSSASHVYHLDGTLPFTPATAGTAVVGHWRSQDITDGTLTASIAWQESSTTIYLYSPDTVGDYAAAENNVGTNNQTNLVCTFTLCYQST